MVAYKFKKFSEDLPSEGNHLKKLTLKDQKRFYYVLSAKNEPTLTIELGETIVIETEDAFSGQIRKPARVTVYTYPYSLRVHCYMLGMSTPLKVMENSAG